MKFRRRIENLERCIDTGTIALQMPDGTVRRIRSARLNQIMGAAVRGDWTTEGIWIRESAEDNGPGDMCNLLCLKWDYDQKHHEKTGKWPWEPGVWDEALLADCRSE